MDYEECLQQLPYHLCLQIPSSPQVYSLLLRLEARALLRELWRVPSIFPGASARCSEVGLGLTHAISTQLLLFLVKCESSSPAPSSCHPSRPKGVYRHRPEQRSVSSHGALALWFELLSLCLPGERARETDIYRIQDDSSLVAPDRLLSEVNAESPSFKKRFGPHKTQGSSCWMFLPLMREVQLL